jgi:hypothetical protein
VHIPATSRQYLIVPAGLLDARPPDDPVDLAITDPAAEPAAWLPLEWLTTPAGRVLGPGILVGPGAGYGSTRLPPGESVLWVREHCSDGTTPVLPWTRLRVGGAAA